MVGMTEPSVLRWRAAYACVGLAGTVALAATTGSRDWRASARIDAAS